jgi:hypothetical protein
MAKIVLGVGTSHTPLFTLESTDWQHRSAADQANPRLNLSDGRWLNYEELLAEVGPIHEEDARPAELERKAALCEAALNRLAKSIEEAHPDVVLIVGDDQGELFGSANQPSFAIYHNDTLMTSDAFGHEGSPDWVLQMGKGYLMDERHTIAGNAAFALKLIEGLIDKHVDVATVADIPKGSEAGLGHAFGFVVKRLFGKRVIPIVPILLNTYYQPNVPTAARCHDIGVLMRQVIEEDGSDLRVCIVASGGLSHFVVDEALDRSVMDAFDKRDASVQPATLRTELGLVRNPQLGPDGWRGGFHARAVVRIPAALPYAGRHRNRCRLCRVETRIDPVARNRKPSKHVQRKSDPQHCVVRQRKNPPHHAGTGAAPGCATGAHRRSSL